MDIHVQKDSEQRADFVRQEIAEIIEAERPKGAFEGVETKIETVNGLTTITPVDVATRQMTPAEKLQRQRQDALLAAKAVVRDTMCWRSSVGCKGRAMTHVAAVEFDLKAPNEPRGHAFIDTSDYPGAVPGFCVGCIGTGPQDLAQAVFMSRPEMQWGFKPTRWFVLFTDGSSQGGDVKEIDLLGTPTYIEQYDTKEPS